MNTIRVTHEGSEATINERFPHQWKVTIGDRTRRGWGVTLNRATNNLLWARHTWNWPWHKRVWVNARAWVETLAEIPLEMHRGNKAAFDLGDGHER